MRYRSRTDIIAMVLRSTVNGASKTRIMYGAYLSYAQLKEYLSFLMEKNLISFDERTGIYNPTEDGLRLLNVYDGISDMISVNGNRTPGVAEAVRSEA